MVRWSRTELTSEADALLDWNNSDVKWSPAGGALLLRRKRHVMELVDSHAFAKLFGVPVWCPWCLESASATGFGSCSELGASRLPKLSPVSLWRCVESQRAMNRPTPIGSVMLE